MKPWWIRAAVVVVTVEIAYLVLVNLGLNLPVTQTLINQHRPEKYAVHWERAWSWYPFRVHARGVSANGQTFSQQWQIEMPAASASLAILPFIQRSVRVFNVTVEDVEYHQRPRPRPDKDYAAIRDYFPPIQNRKVDQAPVVSTPKKKGNGWKIDVRDLHAMGRHRFWIYQVRGAVNGDLHADVSYETRGGPFSLRNGKTKIKLESLFLNKEWEVSKEGFVNGTLEFSPFVPSEHKGMKALAFLKLDADIATQVESLAFVNFYLDRFEGMSIDGAGELTGRLRYEQGKLLPGTDLAVSAPELSVSLLSHRAEGAGDIKADVRPENPDTLNLAIQFGNLNAQHDGDPVPLFSGEGLVITARGGTVISPREDRTSPERYLAVTVPSVTIPDLGVYQRYLPDQWALRLHGGQGELQGRAELSATAFGADLKLVSSGADLAVKDYRFKTDLDLGVKVNSPSLASATVDVSGTYLRLDESRLISQEKGKSQPWRASFAVEKGVFSLPKAVAAQGDGKPPSRGLQEQDLKSVLAAADAEFKAKGSISDLGWINLLFKNPYKMAVAGTGELTANVHISSGWLSQGTLFKVMPKALQVDLLDYVFNGDGLVSLEVKRGGKKPDVNLSVELDDALLKRSEDEQAFVENVALKLEALGKKVAFDGAGEIAEIQLRIPSAKVKDMSVYNQYLPRNAPLELLGGEADLTADVRLEQDSADGFVQLKTNGLRSRLNEQEVSGELTADIKLAGGVPSNMEFDISGSSLLLDKVRVVGDQQRFEQSGWNAQFHLRKARTVWRKPIRLQVEAEIEMQDSRPVVALFANERGKHGWLEKLLTVENVQGEANMILEKEQIVIPYAFAGSDKIDVGAKGVIDAQTRDGVFYARFRKLHGILKVRNGERNFDLIRAKQKFDAYSPNTATSIGEPLEQPVSLPRRHQGSQGGEGGPSPALVDP